MLTLPTLGHPDPLGVSEGRPMRPEPNPARSLVMIDHRCEGLSGEVAAARFPKDDLWGWGHEGATGENLCLLQALPSTAGSLH